MAIHMLSQARKVNDVKNRVLFVDDEPTIRVTLQAILQREGFDVTVAATVPEALDYIAKQRFDALLADMNIGEPGDGFTVISAMRRCQPETATIVLTGYPDFESALKAIRSQVDDYLTKPADVKLVVSAIRENIQKPRRFSPIQSKRVSTVLREQANHIIEEWLAATTGSEELSRIPLSNRERIDHLPAILAELADQVDSERFVAGEEALEAARAHGIQRRKQGFNASNIVAESRLLHMIVSATLQQHLLSIDMSTLFSDLMQFGESLHQQLEESIRAFDEEASPRLILGSPQPPS